MNHDKSRHGLGVLSLTRRFVTTVPHVPFKMAVAGL